ncbi:amino acid adenylation domain-containing protein [Dactylosporangium roseum]|uniref:Phenyloxazoline synthase MbtB n=1 Tax=Dactylosporangium roseum TaxID=47989 RepID=A0ABY5ZAS1_9ACTN|nr:non-ribosomal peptide synthetase [Dactylosporangium roseum]UWZ39116.1 amino acid adenylation domain-containing protein [Dactylosporangium roseum]
MSDTRVDDRRQTSTTAGVVPTAAARGRQPDTTTVVAAFAALLHRYTGEATLVIGHRPAATAPVEVLQVEVPDDATLATLLDRAGAALREPATPGRADLAPVRGVAGRQARLPCHGIVLGSGEDLAAEWSGVALVLDGGTLTVHTDAGADRFARHLGALLRAIGTDAGRTVATVPLLDGTERHRQVVTWNDTAETVDAAFWPDLLRRTAAQRPDAVAVVQSGRTLTFGEVDALANRLAAHLATLGVGAGSRAGVCLERGWEHLVAQFAVFKLGATVVLMDPRYPADRLEFMLADSGAAAVVTRAAYAAHLDLPDGCGVVPVDASWPDGPAVDPGAQVGADTVCHISYTSGSTGVPKAVLQRHGPLRNLVHVLRRACGLDAASRGTWLCSPGLGMVQVDPLPVLAAGGAVHIPPADVAGSPERLREWLAAENVTHTLLLTAMAERVWALGRPDGGALRDMRIAGERLRSWPPADLPYTVTNVYGSAEATVVATCDVTAIARALTPRQRRDRMPPVGRPVANVRAYVLDPNLRPVPVGVLGELFVSGESLSEGYLNRPAANDAKFLPNPIPEDPYPVLYRTGDVARVWDDGTVEVVGRTDNEVKIRGHRLHPGEIESVLGRQPGVRQAAVRAHEIAPGEQRLVAYVEPEPGAAPLVRELRRTLRRQLPPHSVPAAYVLGDLPTTANGKIDRAALPPPPRTRPDMDAPYVAPRDPVEAALVELFTAVLDLDEVGVLDSFLDLGGDSLRAMALLKAVRERFRVELELSELARAPGVAQLARIVERKRAGDDTAPQWPEVSHDSTGRHEPFPLTPNQEALWIGRGDAVDLGEVGAHGYFEWEQDRLDPDRFRLAWRKLVARHDMLRVIIRPDATQVVLPEPPDDGLTVEDLRHLPIAEAETRALAVREEMSHQVIGCATWPLFDVRVTLLPAADGAAGGTVARARLHFGLDMLNLDAWSAFSVLFPELIELYENPDTDLPALAITFRDYLLGTRRFTESAAYRRSRDYWLSRLDSLPAAPDLPMRAAPEGTVRFSRFEHAVEPAEWRRLRRLATTMGVTRNCLLIAAFAEVLRMWSGNDRFTVNFPIFDRMPLHPHVERLVGDFTNTVLVAVEKVDGTFEERARDLQEQLWRDLEHRHFAGVDVLRELARRQDGPLRPAMPIVVTSLLGQPPRRQVSALGREVYGISQTPQVLIDFQIREIDEVLHFKWDYLAELFPPGMIGAMFGAYRTLLRRLAEDDGLRRAERPALVPADQLERRATINDTAVPVPQLLLHDLLALQADRRPDAPAVITTGRRLTFAELCREANRVGRRLRELGATPGTLVGVVMDKGWEQYVAVYGTLVAGAAYLPIDPTVPPERLAYLLDNGEVDLVLTQPSLAGTLSWPERVRVLSVGTDFTDVDDTPLDSVQRPTDLAYVIYTSGSTGEPKGVMVDHRGVVNHVLDINRRLGIGPDDRAFAVAALSFDMSVYDVFGILAAGGAAVLPDAARRTEPDHWTRLVPRERVTFWAAVPALMEMAVDRAETRGPDLLGALRHVVLAGDWIPLDLPDRLRALAPRVRVYSCGGPTETINWSIIHPIGAVDPGWASIPYGRPTANQRYHILDRRLEHRPVWAPGEMYVGGEVGLAHGYWRDEQRTRAKFLRLPGTGERVYATGDIGRYLPDGDIEILGRDDAQVKIQGYRVEPGEIEAALERCDEVQRAVVVAPRDGNGRRRLTAFAVGHPGRPRPDPRRLTDHLRGTLPGYLVPTDLRVLDRLPLTGNGKVDRRALTELARRPPTGDADAEREPTPLEVVLAMLYAEVLDTDRIGVTDNFFHLGGDSITASRLAGRIGEAFGIGVSLRTVLTLPTVAEVSAALAADPQTGESCTRLAAALVGLTDDDVDSLLGGGAASRDREPESRTQRG